MKPRPTVFVVDDDEGVRRMLTQWVEAAGLGVATFASVDEFLGAHTPGQPGCLLFDVRTPGVSEGEFQSRLASARVDMPVILVAGQQDMPSIESVVQAGEVEVILKPCTEVLVVQRIRQAIQRDAMRRRHQSHTPAATTHPFSGRRRTDAPSA